MPDARLHLQLLGPFHLRRGNQPVAGFDQARLQQLLAYLVLHRSAAISRQQLAFVFWPDSTDQQALKNFRTLLTRLRHALGDADDAIDTSAQTIRWRPDAPLKLDVSEFEKAMDRAAEAEASGERAAAEGALAAAVAAYTGDLLPDCYDDWILPLRERLHQAYGDALERLVLLLEEERDYRRAIPYAERLLQHDSLHEPAYRHLMRLHLALGERADARRVYNACVEMLQREFGIGPTSATRSIYERLIITEDRHGLASPATNAPGAARGASTGRTEVRVGAADGRLAHRCCRQPAAAPADRRGRHRQDAPGGGVVRLGRAAGNRHRPRHTATRRRVAPPSPTRPSPNG